MQQQVPFLVFSLIAITIHLTLCICEASGFAIGLGGQGKVTRCSNWGRQSRFWQRAGALEEIPGELCCAPYLNRADELAPFQRRVTRAERDLETRHDRDVCKRRGDICWRRDDMNTAVKYLKSCHEVERRLKSDWLNASYYGRDLRNPIKHTPQFTKGENKAKRCYTCSMSQTW